MAEFKIGYVLGDIESDYIQDTLLDGEKVSCSKPKLIIDDSFDSEEIAIGYARALIDFKLYRKLQEKDNEIGYLVILEFKKDLNAFIKCGAISLDLTNEDEFKRLEKLGIKFRAV